MRNFISTASLQLLLITKILEENPSAVVIALVIAIHLSINQSISQSIYWNMAARRLDYSRIQK